MQMGWMVVFILIAWVASGTASYIYWWTKAFDVTTAEIPISIVLGAISGPFAFFIGWLIHGDSNEPVVIFKKRKG